MQNYQYIRGPGQNGISSGGDGQNQSDIYVNPTDNRFAPLIPLDEWSGYSMNCEPGFESMELEAMRGKIRRFSTGNGQLNSSVPNLDDKLSYICEKLDNLEKSSQTIATIAQNLNSVHARVVTVENQNTEQNRFLKVLAYKSIDLEARSRRKNLVFHGFTECPREDCYLVLRDFLWQEMGLDIEDLGIERVHRLGSLHKAKLRSDPSRRPIIAALYEYRRTDTVMNTCYMLRNTRFSDSRDYPKEIVSARQWLLPQFKAARQNKNDKVSMEYPAKLVVNGRLVADEFVDWYTVLSQDRYRMANGESFVETQQQQQQQQQHEQQQQQQQNQ